MNIYKMTAKRSMTLFFLVIALFFTVERGTAFSAKTPNSKKASYFYAWGCDR